jgi:hypothetical protein
MTAAGVLLLWAMQPAVIVQGGARCPYPDEVAHRLGELMAAVPDGSEQDRAEVSDVTGALRIELVRPDGVRIAERELARDTPCTDLAAAAAVVIATWEAQLRPQRVRPVNLAAEAGDEGPPRAVTYDVGLSGLGSLAGGQAATGLVADGAWAPPTWEIGLHATLGFTTTRFTSVPAAVGTVGYWRSSVAVGPRYRIAGGLARADVHVGLLAGLLSMRAHGLTVNSGTTVGRLGAEAGFRIGPAWEDLVPWLGVGAQYWPGHERMVVDINGMTEQHDVPGFDLRLTLGVSLGRFN